MKLLGMLLIAAVGTGWGLMMGRRVRERAAALELLARFAERLAERIRYTAAPLYALWQEMIPEFEQLPLLRQLNRAALMQQDWCEAVPTAAEEMYLNAEDTRLLTEFIRGLGKADVEGERRRCCQYAAQFRSRGEEARAESTRKGALYVTLGICGGSMAALLLGG